MPRVISTIEFLKRLKSIEYPTTGAVPNIEVCPNWQLRLSMPNGDGTFTTYLSPNPDEMTLDEYTLFLSEVDILALSTLAASFILDRRMP